MDTIRDIASFHHETLDGLGYPFGLKANELSFSSKLLAVADIGSALLAKRSYKKACPKNEVILILKTMAQQNKIDSIIADMLCTHLDDIDALAQLEIAPLQHTHREMLTTFHDTLKHILELEQDF